MSDTEIYRTLVSAQLRRSLGNDDSYEEYMVTHVRMGLDPFTSCADNTCRFARSYARTVLDDLGDVVLRAEATRWRELADDPDCNSLERPFRIEVAERLERRLT